MSDLDKRLREIGQPKPSRILLDQELSEDYRQRIVEAENCNEARNVLAAWINERKVAEEWYPHL